MLEGDSVRTVKPLPPSPCTEGLGPVPPAEVFFFPSLFRFSAEVGAATAAATQDARMAVVVKLFMLEGG